MDQIILLSLTLEELKNIIRKAVREELKLKEQKQLLNFREVCELLGCSSSALNKQKSDNRILYKKMGKRIFFDRKETLDALKDSNYKKLKELQSIQIIKLNLS